MGCRDACAPGVPEAGEGAAGDDNQGFWGVVFSRGAMLRHWARALAGIMLPRVPLGLAAGLMKTFPPAQTSRFLPQGERLRASRAPRRGRGFA